VDERPPNLPLADDPSFLASLSDLDHGVLDDATAPVRTATAPQLPRLARPPASSGALRLTPEASAALAAASAALAAFDTRPPAIDQVNLSEPRVRRDLFPRENPVTIAAEPVVRSAAVDSAPVASPRRRGPVIALMIGLTLAGAAGAGWIFRGSLQRVLTGWHLPR
jgi:hypothetical protein